MIHLWKMSRATKAEKAQHLNAAHALLRRQLVGADAVRQLAREFHLSERQAYRYLEKASQLNRPVEIPEATIPVTLKLPPRTVELLRKYAKSSGMTIGATVTAALHAFLRTLKRHG
jgi:predicted DNA-binding transcriptional regulator YafY